MEQRNIRLLLSYRGTRYHGWQRQKNGISIQEVLEERIEKLTGHAVRVAASGRTDAGVHALGQVCHFLTPSSMAPQTIKNALNSLLPNDIYVREAVCAPLDFHARYSAKSKTYEYRMLNREAPDIFAGHLSWHVRMPLDRASMSACLSLLKGTHDFTSFRSSGSGNTNPVRTIFQASLEQGPDRDRFQIRIQADGFLRHMVRSILGTLVDAGVGKTSVERFGEILAGRDRRLAGCKAPAHGLYLVEVQY